MVRIAGRLRAAIVIGCAGVTLAGCLNTGSGAFASLSGAPTSEKIDAPGVPIAVESIEGAPEGVKAELVTAMASEASARHVELVSTGAVRYRVKGYLTAFDDDEGGTTLAFVWDVFDAAKRRSRRIEGVEVTKSVAGADPWRAMDKAVLTRLASQSMNEIAGFLVGGGFDAEGTPTASAK